MNTNYHKNIHDYGRPIARARFIAGDNETLKPVDYESLHANVEFINVLKPIIGNDDAIDEMLENLIEKCQQITAAIDIELKNSESPRKPSLTQVLHGWTRAG